MTNTDRMRSLAVLVAAFSVVYGAKSADLTTEVGAKSVIRPIAQNECTGLGEHLFKEITNCSMTDDPKSLDPAPKDYRLSSRMKVSASCSGGKLSAWDLRDVQVAFGSEGPLVASGELHKPLVAVPAKKGTNGPAKVTFSYAMRGRPAAAAEALFLAAKPNQPRKCRDIWHQVDGVLQCNGAAPSVELKVSGSEFPTHRAWVANGLVQEVKQGSVGALWVCSPTDPKLIK